MAWKAILKRTAGRLSHETPAYSVNIITLQEPRLHSVGDITIRTEDTLRGTTGISVFVWGWEFGKQGSLQGPWLCWRVSFSTGEGAQCLSLIGYKS